MTAAVEATSDAVQARARDPLVVAVAVGFLMLATLLVCTVIFPTRFHPKDVDDWMTMLGFAFGAPGAVLALFTYARGVREQRCANLWKRREYLATRFDRLETLPSCQAAMLMLDYNATYVDVPALKGVKIHDDLVTSALAPRVGRGKYTRAEQAIRLCFDTFLNELDRLAALAAAGLVDSQDLGPYADYWLQLFSPRPRGRKPVYGAALRRYVRVFGYRSLGQLLQAQGLMHLDDADAAAEEIADDVLLRQANPNWIAPPTAPPPTRKASAPRTPKAPGRATKSKGGAAPSGRPSRPPRPRTSRRS